jgi:hypothetical protein
MLLDGSKKVKFPVFHIGYINYIEFARLNILKCYMGILVNAEPFVV